MNLSELTFFELFKLHLNIGFEVLKRIWWFPVLLVIIFIIIDIYNNKKG